MIFYTVMFQMFSLLIMIGTGYVATKKGMIEIGRASCRERV